MSSKFVRTEKDVDYSLKEQKGFCLKCGDERDDLFAGVCEDCDERDFEENEDGIYSK